MSHRSLFDEELTTVSKTAFTPQRESSDLSPVESRGVAAPVFETKWGKLYCADAIEWLKTLPSESVDLIFADPPYNIKKAEWDTFASQQQYVDWSLKWIQEAHRILKPTGTLYICGFSEILADVKWAAASLFAGCKWLVWHYRNKANMGGDWGRSHESILHFRKSREFTFNLDAVREPYNQHTLRYPEHPQAETSQYGTGKQYVWHPNPLGAKPRDVFEIPTLCNTTKEKTFHPTQKPEELLTKLVAASSHEGDLVIDPFSGSGTTSVVCERLKRRWLGCEINPLYCALIRDRLLHPERYASERNRMTHNELSERRARLKNGR